MSNYPVGYKIGHYRVFLKILTHFFRFLLLWLLQHKDCKGLELIGEH